MTETMNEDVGRKFNVLTTTIVTLHIVCEVCKQISFYAVQYHNAGSYPVPQTIMVFVCEAIKLIFTIIRAKGELPSFSFDSLKSSLRFLFPSLLYAINANIFLYGFTLVSPPVWLMLTSVRTAITAACYKFFLRRPLFRRQFIGAFLIVISICTMKIPDLMNDKDDINRVPLSACILAFLAATNSVIAAVYIEIQFKNSAHGGESFLQQQFWLYFYGSVVALVMHHASFPEYGIQEFYSSLRALPSSQSAVFIISILMGSLGGLLVATILKLLDNIVKDYSTAASSIVTSIFSRILFPEKFQFTAYIVASMLILFTGVYLYETKEQDQEILEDKVEHQNFQSRESKRNCDDN